MPNIYPWKSVDLLGIAENREWNIYIYTARNRKSR